MALSDKNILIVLPRNQFDERELSGTLEGLRRHGPKIVILSKTGQEAVAMNKTRFLPDGMLVDWDKQPGISGKYDAVIVLGGKGAPKSLWNDDILPQILTDHFRSGRIIGGLGLGVGALARASLLTGEASGPKDATLAAELERAGVSLSSETVTCWEQVITGAGGETAEAFADAVTNALERLE